MARRANRSQFYNKHETTSFKPGTTKRQQTKARGASFQLDVEILRDFAKAAKKDFPEAQKAINAANKKVALGLQAAIVKALVEGVTAHNRTQRPDELLVKALRDRRFVALDNVGFSLGGIELYAPQVKPYYLGLEVGQRKFIGRRVVGMFSSTAAKPYKLVRFNKAGGPRTDPIFVRFQGSNETPRASGFYDQGNTRKKRGRPRKYFHRPTIQILHPIQGYHYFEKGTAAFRKNSTQAMVGAYIEAFKARGGNFFEIWVGAGGPAGGPRASDSVQRLILPQSTKRMAPRPGDYDRYNARVERRGY